MPMRILGVALIWVFGAVVGAATAVSNTHGRGAPHPVATATISVPAFVTETSVVTASPYSMADAVPGDGSGFDGDGTYLVPSEVRPGTYRSARPVSGNCYWERARDTTGDSTLANGNSRGQVTLTVLRSDGAVIVHGCERFVRVR